MNEAANVASVRRALSDLLKAEPDLGDWEVESGTWDAFGSTGVEYVDLVNPTKKLRTRVSPGDFECWLSVTSPDLGEVTVDLGEAETASVVECLGAIARDGLRYRSTGWVLQVRGRLLKFDGGHLPPTGY